MGIRKNPRNTSNPWTADWRVDGKRYRKSFRTRRDAELFEANRLAGNAPSTREHEQVQLRQVHALWWEKVTASGGYNRQPLAPQTRKLWAFYWKSYVAPEWEYVPVTRITYDRIVQWAESMRSVENPNALAGARTRQEAIRVLRKVLDYAVLSRYLNENPALNRLGKVDYWPHLEPEEKHALTGDQLVTLADEIGNVRESYRAMILFMGTSGPRPSEAFALFPPDFYERGSGRLARISRTLQEDKTLGPTKNRRVRNVPVFKAAYDLLPLDGDPKEPVFGGTQSRYLDLRNWRKRVFAPVVEHLASNDPLFPKITPHGLRHTAVSLAIANGASVHVVQKIADHAKASTTMDVYRHLFDQEMVDAMSAVETSLNLNV